MPAAPVSWRAAGHDVRPCGKAKSGCRPVPGSDGWRRGQERVVRQHRHGEQTAAQFRQPAAGIADAGDAEGTVQELAADSGVARDVGPARMRRSDSVMRFDSVSIIASACSAPVDAETTRIVPLLRVMVVACAAGAATRKPIRQLVTERIHLHWTRRSWNRFQNLQGRREWTVSPSIRSATRSVWW